VSLTELPLILGRAAESGVVLEHPSVSNQHARLYRDPNFGLCVEDLGSLNGVYIDNQLTRRNLLHRDCRLSLGEVVVLFRAGAGQA
jgi:pSer/pThr/pTyr-binding forkhead associated (FHA) protein